MYLFLKQLPKYELAIKSINNAFYFQLLQLFLPDGIPTEVVVTSVVSCNHIFVQQILHPSYAELARLDNSMSVFYHHTELTPHLPRPIQSKEQKNYTQSF